MKQFTVLIALLLLALTGTTQEWTTAFNGKNTKGWKHVGDGKFVIENGLLKTQSGMGLLYFKRPLENVVIKVVYKNPNNHNAGVFIRIPEIPKEAWMPVNKGYEVQIDEREDEYHKTGVLYSLTKAKATPGKIGEEWNTMEITLQGNRTLVTVNGVLVTDFTEGDLVPEKQKDYEPNRGPRPNKGYIGLQNHGGDDVIYFKEVSYRPL